jgi:hypothetical protein
MAEVRRLRALFWGLLQARLDDRVVLIGNLDEGLAQEAPAPTGSPQPDLRLGLGATASSSPLLGLTTLPVGVTIGVESGLGAFQHPADPRSPGALLRLS